MADSDLAEAEDEFGFSEGDTVLVRVRERGTSGNIVAKFEATCTHIHPRSGLSTPRARFDLPWGTSERTTLRPYDAEFEVVEE